LIIDLTQTEKFNKELNKLYLSICYKNIKGYNELIKIFSKQQLNNIYWWVGSPVSRNILVSKVFINYCKIQLIIFLIERGDAIDKIYVCSKAMRYTLNQIPGSEKIKIIVKNISYKSLFIKTLYPLYIFIMEFIRHFWKLIIYKICFSNKNTITNKSLTLIDTFVFPGYFSKDRYYNGLWEMLNEKEKNSVFFVPTIIMTKLRNIYSAFEELIESDRKFLFKEHFLSVYDVVRSTFYPIRIQFCRINPVLINKIDYSSLITDDLKKNTNHFTLSIEGLINYHFIKRLSYDKIKLYKIVDWWESQAIDKGLHKALNKYFPETKNVGYLGYAPRELEIQLYPTKYEVNYGIVPQNILVIGEGFSNVIKKFNPDYEVDFSPAFRFKHLWSGNNFDYDKNYYTILIGLPITFNDAICIIDMIIDSLDDIDINSIRFWIKPHPTMAKNKIKDYYGDRWPFSFEFVEAETKELLRKCNILISGMSSICLEAIAIAIPVLVIENSKQLHFNPIPKEVNNELWKLCESKEDITESIDYFKNRNDKLIEKHKILSYEVRKMYFEPLSREGIAKLL